MELLKPIYFKDKEIHGIITNEANRVSDYELSVATSKVVNDIQCIQKDRGLWRVYVKSSNSRSKLLQEGFDIRNRHISVYDTNPFSAGTNEPSEQVLKITVKGVPLSVDDDEIMKMLKQFDLNFTSGLKYENIIHPETRKMTGILNGNRFIYVSALPDSKFLPRQCKCAGLQCFIYHYGQPSNKRTPLCTNCWEATHYRRDCPNSSRCKVCKKGGHSPGDDTCDHYTAPLAKVVPFAGASDTLSNFFPCEIKAFGVTHKSSEHAFQYVKAVRSGDIPKANAIQSATTALDAKKIGKTISNSTCFESEKLALMTEIIEAKFDQVSAFREALRKAKKSTIFVEATYDDFWASGIDKEGTIHTHPTAWPGQNKLGEILANVATSHSNDNRTTQRSNSAPRMSKESSQRAISSMLSELRAPRKRDCSGTRKISPKSHKQTNSDG